MQVLDLSRATAMCYDQGNESVLVSCFAFGISMAEKAFVARVFKDTPRGLTRHCVWVCVCFHFHHVLYAYMPANTIWVCSHAITGFFTSVTNVNNVFSQRTRSSYLIKETQKTNSCLLPKLTSNTQGYHTRHAPQSAA